MFSASGDCIRDSGGDMGISGRSSRKRDMVRFGTPEATRRDGTMLAAGVGAGVVGIESRDVLENEEGPPELRFFLLPHLKNEAQERGPLGVRSSDSVGGTSDRSVLD
jgi:hypothetical protein